MQDLVVQSYIGLKKSLAENLLSQAVLTKSIPVEYEHRISVRRGIMVNFIIVHYFDGHIF